MISFTEAEGRAICVSARSVDVEGTLLAALTTRLLAPLHYGAARWSPLPLWRRLALVTSSSTLSPVSRMPWCGPLVRGADEARLRRGLLPGLRVMRWCRLLSEMRLLRLRPAVRRRPATAESLLRWTWRYRRRARRWPLPSRALLRHRRRRRLASTENSRRATRRHLLPGVRRHRSPGRRRTPGQDGRRILRHGASELLHETLPLRDHVAGVVVVHDRRVPRCR